MSETQVTSESQAELPDDLDAFATDFFGQKSVDEVESSTQTIEDAEQVPADSGDELDVTEAPTDDDNLNNPAEPEKSATSPQKSRVQDRIDEVVRQREELRRSTDAEIAHLRQELEAAKQRSLPVSEPETAEPTPDDIDENGDPIYALGEFDPQFIRDLTHFTLNQERQRLQAEQAELQQQQEQAREQQTLQVQWNERVEVAAKEHPDFEEKGRELLMGFNSLEPTYAQYLSRVLMSMDNGPEVLYYLANHPEEAVAIVNSGAQKATLALGRIEARFDKVDSVAPQPKASKAPPPPPVRARGTNGAFVAVAPDTDDLEAFSTEFFAKRR